MFLCFVDFAGVCYNENMELAGKTALVTGASGKIGRVLVPVLASQGVRCVCQFNTQNQVVGELTEELSSLKGDAVFAGADLAAPGGIETLFEAVDQVGGAQILIQLAGTFERTPAAGLDEESIRSGLAINLAAPIRIAREFAQRVPNTGKALPAGKMVHFTDITVMRPWAEYSVYCAAKAGLNAFTQVLAKELAPRILVNAVAPGVLEGNDLDEAQLAKELGRIPAGRLGRIEEVVDAVFFLLWHDYVNGQVLTIDGGRSL